MKLTICYDGQFYIGLVENISENKYNAYRYVFGKEPKDQEVFDFVNTNLLDFIKNNDKHGGIPIQQNKVKKINPKRLQRKVAKELKNLVFPLGLKKRLKLNWILEKKRNLLPAND